MIEVGWGEPADPSSSPRPVSMNDIIEQVAHEYGLTRAEILARRRHRSIVYARQHAMWRCKKETSASLPEIARAFGGFDHTTVIHAVRSYEKRMGMNGG